MSSDWLSSLSPVKIFDRSLTTIGIDKKINVITCACMCHWMGGWVSCAHFANLLEQTKRSVVVVTNKRGVLLVGGWVLLFRCVALLPDPTGLGDFCGMAAGLP